MFAYTVVCALLAVGVNEEENKDGGGEYHEFNVENPNYQQEFLEDTDGCKSNLILFDAC